MLFQLAIFIEFIVISYQKYLRYLTKVSHVLKFQGNEKITGIKNYCSRNANKQNKR